MKKTIIILLLIISAASVKAQPFAGMALNYNNAEIHGGYMFDDDIELTAVYRTPFYDKGIDRVASLSISIRFDCMDCKQYMRLGSGIAVYNGKTGPNFRFELGRRLNQGTIFLLTDYSSNLSLMGGIKFYLKSVK